MRWEWAVWKAVVSASQLPSYPQDFLDLTALRVSARGAQKEHEGKEEGEST